VLDKKNLKQAKKRFEVIPGQGKRFSFSNLKQALVFYVLLLLALVILVQLGYHWLGEQFQAWRLGVVEAETGLMEQQAEVTGIITRNETVITAPTDGVLIKLAVVGERVPVGSELARIGQLTPAEMQLLQESEEDELSRELWGKIQQYWQQVFPEEDEDQSEDNNIENQVFSDIIIIKSAEAGFISYYLDSWESFAGPLYLTAAELERELPTGTYTVEGDLVEKGQPILKVVDNWQWFYSVVLPLHPGRIISGLQQIYLEFDFAPGEQVQAVLIDSEIEEKLQEVRLTYQIEKQLPGFDLARVAGATLLYEQKSGIIVPEEAIMIKDNVTGVYSNQSGRIVFIAVTVVEKQDDKIMIEGLEPHSLVITRPELVTEGQRLN
jgi:putative membrane fusion protein